MSAEAEAELERLPAAEEVALGRALEKLELAGETLGFPHTSAVRISQQGLRELRPKRGSSRWRALYRRIGDRFWVVAIGPEAETDPTGFRRAVRLADARVARLLEQEYGDRH